MKEIEDFLRQNKPQVNNDPTFILETQRRMTQVEGIKAEVDRQRRRGHLALIVALAAGLAIGVIATAIAFLYPLGAGSVGDGLWQSIRLFLNTWKLYLPIPVAVMAILLSLIAISDRRRSVLR